MVDGEAARALGDLARERWFRATWERTVADEVTTDPWPEGIAPDMTNVEVGIARTEPKYGGRGEVRENERLYLEAIRRARSLIYLENQYFTSPVLAKALAERLAEPDGPEIVLVSTGTSPSWFDGITMDTARAEVLYRLEQADDRHGFFAFAPLSSGGERIIVHAKLAIFDDQMLRVGSTNLNNRSLGFDTECDIAVLPCEDQGQAGIQAYRHRSIAHFIGTSPAEFAEAEAQLGSMGRAIESFASPRMRALGADQPSFWHRLIAEYQLGDPVSTSDAFRPWKRRTRSQRPPKIKAR